MPFDSIKDPAADPLVSRPRRIPPPLMIAGVAGACVLGAGLGLWAKPTNLDNGVATLRPAAAAAARPQAPQQIEIRIDRPPAPAPEAASVAEPEVALPLAAEPAPAAEAPALPSAPKEPPEGLVKVRAVVPARLAEEAPPKPDAEPRKATAAPAAATAAAAARKKAEAARAAREEAEVAAARKRRLEKARLAAAEAEAREKAEAKARERAERRLAEQKAAERLAEKKAAARLAEKKAAERRLADKAATEKKKAQLAAQKAAKPAAPRVQTVKVVKAGPRCAAADPGAALACTDPALGAADRRLARAYREAEEAGVPPERLERQQRRWLQARANAARQAPWAVHDIYLARIAELEDQAREAERGDY